MSAALEPIFPGAAWKTAAPERTGLDAVRLRAWLARQAPCGSSALGEQPGPGEWGAVLVSRGYRVHAWGDPDYRFQSASVGKAFTRLALQLAIDAGALRSDTERVGRHWSGAGQLSHAEKQLDRGLQRTLTFRQLWRHEGGFAVSDGFAWRRREGVPTWARWTGDPAFDNRCHAEPGTRRHYASGGYWRLSQALTAVFEASLKDVLDRELFAAIGIPAERWDWLSGEHVLGRRDFYPARPGYGDFLDPPYRVAGSPCVGGGGWVVMSAHDLARVGLLLACGGCWEGRRLLGSGELLAGHRGANESELTVVSAPGPRVFARVTTAGLSLPESELAGL